MNDEQKIAAIAALAVAKMKESSIPSDAAYDVAEVITLEFKKKGAKLPPGFMAGLIVKIKDLLK